MCQGSGKVNKGENGGHHLFGVMKAELVLHIVHKGNCCNIDRININVKFVLVNQNEKTSSLHSFFFLPYFFANSVMVPHNQRKCFYQPM